MAMNLGRAQDDMVTDINTTPLIDIMLVLLTLLIITLPLQTHAIKIDLPQGTTNLPPPQTIDLAIDFNGAITWNGQSVTQDQLERRFAEVAQSDPQPIVRVEADKLAHYGLVAGVLADAQRNGVKKIGIDDAND
jgi:biopolymer transport protein ExbD